MIPLRATTVIDAPEGAVRRVLARADVWTRTARALGARTEVAGPIRGSREPLRTGDLLRVGRDPGPCSWLLPPRSLILGVTVDAHRPPALDLVAGPLRHCSVTLTTASTAAGTLVTVDFRVMASPAVLTPLLRGRVLEAAQLLLGIATLAARETLVVVAGALIADGRVLAARRTGPPELAGKWELPGGKVEPGETEKGALARELAEELGLAVIVGERIGTDVELGDKAPLRCYRCEQTDGRAMPGEHEAVQWVGAAGLEDVDWLEPDRQLLPALRLVLQG